MWAIGCKIQAFKMQELMPRRCKIQAFEMQELMPRRRGPTSDTHEHPGKVKKDAVGSAGILQARVRVLLERQLDG